MSKRRSTETVEAAESRDKAVAELSDAIESLEGDAEGLEASADGDEGRAGWTEIDPAGTSAKGGDELEDESDELEDEDDQLEDEGDDLDDEGDLSEETGFVIHDADAEDHAEELARNRSDDPEKSETTDDEIAPGGQPRELAELVSICEALIFVSEEPLTVKAMADVLGEDKGWVQVACEQLAQEFNERNGGLMLREVAGGWQLATRPEHHEHIRAFLKSKPSAKLSLAALETLAVIAYKQPVTVPEILEIRGVQSSSAIKTLLDKRLIVAKGRKETVGRPMMYGTSKEFLLQFGLRDLSELPNVEDFEDLAAGGEA
jgi:segregation and condensation protein B